MKKINYSLLFILTVFFVSCNKDVAQLKDTGVEHVKPLICRAGQPDRYNAKPNEVTPEMIANAAATKAGQKYTIPVVFHVFGEDQGSGTLDQARMETVLAWVNNDFNMIINDGDPETFLNVDPKREDYVSSINFEFVLAKFDPQGNATTGVVQYDVNHPANRLGLGNWEATPEIAKIAWDNYKYFNIYITNDLYGDGTTNNSGIAWYPNRGMSDSNCARVVYNGAYLPGAKNIWDPDFQSVITHEIGHWFDLPHTFNESGLDYCDKSLVDGDRFGDEISDTPQMECSSNSDAYYGHGKKNCVGEVIDFGNFMNYGVYCNFTKGQVERMKIALEHPSRKTLWQPANLRATLGK
ncbi:MAG: M43 family zinc metalloprotease [Rikenellaceae bacterium]